MSTDKWVLVRAILPVTESLYGSYAVMDEEEFEAHPNLWEHVLTGNDGSASEWARLLDIRDHLRTVGDVMLS